MMRSILVMHRFILNSLVYLIPFSLNICICEIISSIKAEPKYQKQFDNISKRIPHQCRTVLVLMLHY